MLRKFKSLKIASKLILGFLVVAILAGVIGFVGITNIVAIGNDDKTLFEKRTLGLHYSSDAVLFYQKIRSDITTGLLAAGTSTQETYLASIGDNISKVDESLENIKACIVDQDDRQDFEEMQTKWNTYKAMIDNVTGLMKDYQNDEARNIVFSDMQAVSSELQSAFNEMNDDILRDAQLMAASNAQAVNLSVIIMLGIAAAGMFIALGLGIAISRMISKPIRMVADDAERLAIGQVDIESENAETGKDETGQLIESFRKLAAERKNQVRETQRLAAGDLAVDIRMKSEKDVLNQSLMALAHNINEMVLSIKKSAEQVASGSGLLSESSMTLSQGASEQASSVEQLTAVLQELTCRITLNVQHAQYASQLTMDVKADAENGNTRMREMLSAMGEINQSSTQINRIIKVIDDIAFQTNILALNAAVEAARAGVHGKGFVVVAEEVRALAARSANAAKETAELIEGSIRKVETGMLMADHTSRELDKIVGEVIKAADTVNEIARDSTEQAIAIEQINQGVLMISDVVQNNAATTEENAAASEELSSQAEQLKELISTFRVNSSTSYIEPYSELTKDRPTARSTIRHEYKQLTNMPVRAIS